jgi:N-acetyl-gamma-glutamyl-phosphate reductase
MGKRVQTAVLGASGYAGGELLRLLASHPHLEVTFLGGDRSAGRPLAEVHPHLGELPIAGLQLRPSDASAIAAASELVFSALPHGESARLAPPLLEAGCTLVDLAGDFRLDAESYPVWYGFEHPAPAWLDRAVYGLPELLGEALPGAKLVADPGCSSTPVILGCAPLLAAGLIQPTTIRVDGKTGLSGAGRTATEFSSFASTDGSIRPYRRPGHQHTPEMERGLELTTGTTTRVLFVPHLVPSVRGVVTTAYPTLGHGVTTGSLTDCLAAAFAGRPFVRVQQPGGMVDAKRTRGTNVVELQAVADPCTGTAVALGALDNLIKGAAGQAIQNANLAFGFRGRHGPPHAGGVPVSAGAW